MSDVTVNQINTVLQLQGQTPQTLSEETGIAFRRIERIVASELAIHPNEIIKIAKGLNMKVETLLACQHKQGPLHVISKWRINKSSFKKVV